MMSSIADFRLFATTLLCGVFIIVACDSPSGESEGEGEQESEGEGEGASDCNGSSADIGWAQIQVDIDGIQGPMNAPIVSCVADEDSFLLSADGTESDGVDEVSILLAIDHDYSGPGTYNVNAPQGLRAEVSHSDVGGIFSLAEGGSCEICIGDDEAHGAFTCAVLRDANDRAMTILEGAFRCP